MAGEAYQVDYIINLQDRASAGIANFSRAASKLTAAAENLKKFEGIFNQVVGQLSKPLKMSINTQNAHKSLDKVLRKIEKIKNEAGSINVGVASNNVRNRRVTNQTPAPAVAPVRTLRQQGPRPLVGSRAGQPLIPRNLEYQVLGPTRLGNVAMLDMFKGMGLMYGISAIGSGVRDILSQSTEYENIMQTAKNILKTNYKGGNFDASFIDLERIAREVGVETKFTAPEVADAVKFLAMAGLDVNAIKKSIRPIADIALIGDTDLGQTADVMTNIMTAYGIRPDDMRKTADVMTRTFTMSNTTLMELAESFKMAGSMLHLANVPFETAAAAFGVLGDAGIKATMAGTTMRTIMNNLRNPTKNQQKYWDMLGIRRFDEYGNLREINEIFADLNRLNGNDERSRTARAKYEELQKKYAPKLEGLQEGSLEYNSVIAEYDKESEAIRKQFGGVDVFRLFRLTAASGAGVLMNSVEKWNQVIQENFLSQGLSQKLADEKKNTIAGLWAQLKSAFQEGGLKVFEENDGRIRGYLSRGISWLKSTEFTDLLRSVFDLVADLGKMLIWFTEKVVALYNKFSPLVKGFLKFQLYLKGIQVIIGSFRQFGNAALYTALPFLSRIGGRRMPLALTNNQATGLGGIASASGLGTGTLGGLLYYGIPQKWMGKGYSTLLETGNAAAAVRANPNYDPMNHAANVALLQKYQNSNKRIQSFNRNAGWSSMAGAVAGSYLGGAIAPDSAWGATIGGVAGSLGAMALASSSIPYAGWIAAGVLAVAAGTAALIENRRATLKAREAALAYNEVLTRLNTSQWSVTNITELITTSIHVENNALLSQKEKLEANIELWKKYYAAKKGDREDIMDTNEGGYLYANDKMFSSLFDQAKEHGLEFLGKLHYDKTNTDYSYRQTLDNAGVEWAYSKVPLFFRQYGTAKNNNVVVDATDFIQGLLPQIKTIEDFENMRRQFVAKFLTPAGEMYSFDTERKTELEDLTGLSYSELMRYPTFNKLMNYRLNNAFDLMTSGYTDLFSGNGSEGFVKNMQSRIFTEMDGGLMFGGDGFQNQFLDYIQKVSKEGNLISDQVDAYKESLFEKAVELFNQANDYQKTFMLPFLNRTYWTDVLGVDLSNVQGGFNAPTENTPNPYGDMFKWNAQKGYYEYDGMPSYPSLNGETWMYKPLSMQPATEQTNTGAIDVTNTGALAGFHSATSWQDLAASLFYSPYHLNPVRPAEAETANNNAHNGTATTITAQGFPYYPADWIPENTLPPLNNEAFRPVERQQVAMVARPVVININTDRFMDVSNIDIDNQQDTETLRQTMKDVFADIVSEIAADTGGTFNLGVA